MKKISFFVISIFLAMLMALLLRWLLKFLIQNFIFSLGPTRSDYSLYHIISSLSESLVAHVVGLPTSHAVWTTLDSSFSSKSKARALLSINCWLISKSRATCWYFGCCSWSTSWWFWEYPNPRHGLWLPSHLCYNPSWSHHSWRALWSSTHPWTTHRTATPNPMNNDAIYPIATDRRMVPLSTTLALSLNLVMISRQGAGSWCLRLSSIYL